MISMFPIIAWAAVILLGIIVYVCVALTIEKSGEKRLGATGNIFTYTPKEDESGAKKQGNRGE